MSTSPDPTRDLLDYIDASPTPFHAVSETIRRLEADGFSALSERDPWELRAGDRRYVSRDGSTIVALVVGEELPGETGYRLVGAHTDSPNLRLKPRAPYTKKGYRQLGVEVYGGAIVASWTDRDLSIAGRVCLAEDEEPRLLRVDRPLCRVANAAIHLNREVNKKGLLLNKQQHLPPIIGLDPGKGAEPNWFEAFLARELGLADPAQIVSFDLMLYERNPSVISGLDGEFIHAPRLDNLGGCHAALLGLLRALEAGPSRATRVMVLYDNEEVGSRSAVGADSHFLAAILERVNLALGGQREDQLRALARSLFISVDMAHAQHPNYPELHELHHLPRMNAGPVLKSNSNQRYATNARSSQAFLRYAREADVPVQHFVSRTDLACGTTIGPITAARLGIPTVDAGTSMLSMHSAREMAGAHDQEYMIRVLARHFA